MSDISRLAKSLAALADTERRSIEGGSLSLDGGWRFWREWADGGKPRIRLTRGFQESLSIFALQDGTFTIRDGKLQIRKVRDGKWFCRYGTSEWQAMGGEENNDE